MEINDYSTRLAEARNRYNKATTDMRESYNRDLENVEKNHALREKNQAKTFTAQKRELEESNRKNLDRYEKSLTKELDRRTERYRQNLAQEKRDFARNRQDVMKDYKYKLDEISNSFNTASKEKDKLNAAQKEQMEERFQDGLAKRETDFNSKLSKVQIDATDSVKDFRDEQTDEKRMLIGRYENEKKQLVQDANLSRNKASGIHQAELQRMRDTHRQLQDSQKNMFENSVTSLTKDKEAEVGKVRGNFEDLTKNIQERNQEVLKSLNKEHKEDKRSLETTFAGDRIQLERKSNKLMNDAKEVHRVNGTAELQKRFDTRTKDLHDQIENIVETQVANNEKRAAENQDLLKETEIRHSNQMANKDAELRRFKGEELTAVKDKFEANNDLYKKKVVKLETEIQDNAVESDRDLNEKITKQRQEYSKQINRISQKNIDTVNNLNNEFANEKTKLLQNERKRSHDEKKDLLVTMNESFAKKEKSLTKTLENKNKENQALVLSYENQLATFKKKSADEIKSITVLEHQKREALKDSMQQQMETLAETHNKEIEKIRVQNDRKIAEVKSNADLNTFKLTQKYENMLNNERKNALRSLKTKLGEANTKMERLAQAHKLDRETLIEQYESKIDQIIRQSRVENDMTKVQKAT